MKKILLINLISLFIISISFSKEVQNYKVNFNLDNILLKGRDIKESSDFIIKNNIKFNFVKYNEKKTISVETLIIEVIDFGSRRTIIDFIKKGVEAKFINKIESSDGKKKILIEPTEITIKEFYEWSNKFLKSIV